MQKRQAETTSARGMLSFPSQCDAAGLCMGFCQITHSVYMEGFRFPQVVHRGITAIAVSALPFPEVVFWQLVPAGQGAGGTGALASPSQVPGLEDCALLSLGFPSR